MYFGSTSDSSNENDDNTLAKTSIFIKEQQFNIPKHGDLFSGLKVSKKAILRFHEINLVMDLEPKTVYFKMFLFPLYLIPELTMSIESAGNIHVEYSWSWLGDNRPQIVKQTKNIGDHIIINTLKLYECREYNPNQNQRQSV